MSYSARGLGRLGLTVSVRHTATHRQRHSTLYLLTLTQVTLTVFSSRVVEATSTRAKATVCPTVEDGPKWNLAFLYPVSSQAIFMKFCKLYFLVIWLEGGRGEWWGETGGCLPLLSRYPARGRETWSGWALLCRPSQAATEVSWSKPINVGLCMYVSILKIS